MSARGETRLWVAQRATAVVLAVCVAVHLVTIVYAVRGGLSAAAILSRTRGNPLWPAFYTVFVLAAAVHGAIGLRGIAIEWLGLGKSQARLVLWVVALALAGLGLYAVYAVAHS
jgi:succinate dehydrogenase subunit C